MANRTCYFPNAAPDDGLTPCDASAAHTHCCSTSSACLSNGYCLVQNGTYSNRLTRAGCTDSSWQSNACPQQCKETNPSGGATLFLGPQTPSGTFCCFEPYDAANSRCPVGPETPFDLDASWVMNRLNGQAISAVETAQSTTMENAPTLATTTATVTVHKPHGSSAGKNTGIDVGVGIGIPLLLALLVALGCLWHERKKNAKLREQWHQRLDHVEFVGHAGDGSSAFQRRSMVELNGRSKRTLPAELNNETGMTGRAVTAKLDNEQSSRELPGQRI